MMTTTSALRMALLFSLSCLLSTAANASPTFMSFGGTGYVIGSDELLQGHNPSHVLSGSDKYGDPDGWVDPSPSGLVGRAFSSSTALSPPANYFGPTFFGGASVTATNTTTNEGFHQLAVTNSGQGDSIHWLVDSNGANNHSNHVFIYFKKAQFDGLWSGVSPITSSTLAPGSFQLRTEQVTEAGLPDIVARWVVQDGSNFYVSQNTHLLAQNSLYQTDFAAITGWAPYNPTSGLSALDFDETSSFGPQTFTDVQGLGFFVEHENGDAVTHVKISSFVAAVPEPSSFVLLGIAAAMLPLFRRRVI